MTLYWEQHAPTTADPDRIGYAIHALADFWANLNVADVKAETCRRYAKTRGAAESTVRRELGCLQAAINFAHREGALTQTRQVTLPKRTQPRERWLSRSEAARLLQAARREKHLARFILIAIYTGTRKDAILNLQWQPNTDGGHIDLETGVLYRRSAFASVTSKRQPPARLPKKLVTMLRRWRAVSGTHVIEHKGEPVKAIKRSWRTALVRSGISPATPHDLRRTSITWTMQRGVQLSDAAGFYGVTVAELERTYFVHHPDFQSSVLAIHGG
ncbi:MAG: site-specific integrase [Pseudomonadota bacterium]